MSAPQKVRVRPVLNTERVTFGHVGGPSWADRPAYVVGGGGSLRGRDMSRLRDRGYVLGVNRAADLVPCDATVSIDVHFMAKHGAQLAAWAERGQEVYLAVPPDYDRAPIPGATYILRSTPGEGCSHDPRMVVNGLNSGYAAVQVAILKGARTVYLLGFDMVDVPKGEPQHWHGGYPWQGARGGIRCYPDWARRYLAMAREMPPGVRVVNCNPASAVRAFEFGTYEEVGL